MIKTVNISKITTSPRGLKAQTEQEKVYAQKILDKINFDFCTVIFEYNGGLFWCKMPMHRLTDNLAISGKKCKFLAPLGKNQVIDLIEDGTLEKIGSSDDLEKFGKSNNGKNIEYFLARKTRKGFDHSGKMTDGNGEFRGTEVKFFSFDKTSGTPSATCECLASIDR